MECIYYRNSHFFKLVNKLIVVNSSVVNGSTNVLFQSYSYLLIQNEQFMYSVDVGKTKIVSFSINAIITTDIISETFAVSLTSPRLACPILQDVSKLRSYEIPPDLTNWILDFLWDLFI